MSSWASGSDRRRRRRLSGGRVRPRRRERLDGGKRGTCGRGGRCRRRDRGGRRRARRGGGAPQQPARECPARCRLRLRVLWLVGCNEVNARHCAWNVVVAGRGVAAWAVLGGRRGCDAGNARRRLGAALGPCRLGPARLGPARFRQLEAQAVQAPAAPPSAAWGAARTAPAVARRGRSVQPWAAARPPRPPA